MATIREVAKHAGVSPATVCRILAQETDFKVTEETRAKVFASAELLGYQYEPRKRIAEKFRFGFILPMTVKKYSDPFFTEILSAAEQECLKQNASIVSIRNCDELRHPDVLHELCTAKLSGLILCEEIPADILEILQATIPQFIAADLPYSPFECVGYDYTAANLQVMNLLIGKGYRRIAYIGGNLTSGDFMRNVRMSIYRDSLFCAGITPEPSLIRNCNWDLELCQQYTAELMSMDNPPDVIFAGSDSLAVVVLNTLLKMGLRCPEDVGVIGFNNIEISAHTFPPLTTVDIPAREIGIELVRRLVARINGDTGLPRSTLFRTRIIERESLR